jgi:hypothetical protein
VVTLHSPHQGSHLGNVASDLNDLVAACRARFGPIADQVLGGLVDEVDAASYQELSAGSPFLADLATSEVPFPGARYHTFGGTSPLYTRLLWWVFDPGSLFPHFRWPPFHWTIAKGEVPFSSPLLNALPDLAPELAEGGDGLVADANARLGFASHTTLALNHAEALWDPGLQERVLGLLDDPGVPVAPPAEHPDCPSVRDKKAEAQAEILALQADLREAAPGQKPAIAAAIGRWRQVLAQADRRAVALGCSTH